jgi:outer membrane protein OmpA-like peptidoglycan-associated protein
MKILFTAVFILLTQYISAQDKKNFTVYFATDSYSITATTAVKLDSFIANQPNAYSIVLHGYCDSRGSADYNIALSNRRSLAVKNYIASKGIPAQKIIEKRGFGKEHPLNQNSNDIEMAANRRVEIFFLEKGEVYTEPVNNTEPTLTAQLEDTLTKTPNNIVLHSLNFVGGYHIILKESLPILVELLQAMKKNIHLSIAIEGHVCCIPDAGDGYDFGTRTNNLSENRAKEVYNYLIQNGINKTRLSYVGFGHAVPLIPYPEATESEKTKNRRVEIRIVNR